MKHLATFCCALLTTVACGPGLYLGTNGTAASSAWKKLAGETPYLVDVGTKGVSNVNNLPWSRGYSAFCSNGSVGFMYGGQGPGTDGGGNIVSDLWKFDGTSWTWLSGEGANGINQATYASPTTGIGHPALSAKASCTIGSDGSLWLFGGGGSDSLGVSSSLATLWKYSDGVWNLLAGPDTGNAAGVYGVLNVEGPGYPGGRHSAAMWMDASGAVWVFGGQGYDSTGSAGALNDLWRWNPATGKWTWKGGSNLISALGTYGGSPYPGARMLMASAYDPVAGKAWIFGGQGFGSAGALAWCNELWSFDGTNWTAVFGTGVTNTWKGVYQSKGSFDAAAKPGPRMYAALWIDSGSDVWISSGYGSPNHVGQTTFGNMNDLWRFRPTSGQWQWVKGIDGVNAALGVDSSGVPTDTAPEGLAAPAAFSIGGSVYLYGGWMSQTGTVTTPAVNRLWKWDGTNWAWLMGTGRTEKVPTYGTQGVQSLSNSPGPRDVAIQTYSDGKIYLFGGSGFDSLGQMRYLADLWSFDTASNTWTWEAGIQDGNVSGTYGTKGTPSMSNNPGSRGHGAIWKRGSDIYLMGGIGFGTTNTSERWLNDLWKYSSSTGWTWVSGDNTTDELGVFGTQGVAASSNQPGGRRAGAYWQDASQNLYMFGGSGYATGGTPSYLNDLWMYDGTNWTWLSGSNVVSQFGVYGVQGTADSANTPGARTFINFGFDNSTQTLYLFGGKGYGESGAVGGLSDLWKFQNGQWTWLSGPKTSDAAEQRGAKGVSSSSYYPGPRLSAAVWASSAGDVYISGGYYQVNGARYFMSDTWKYSAGQWSWVDGSSSPVLNDSTLGSALASDALGYGAGVFIPFLFDQSANTGYFFGGQGIDTNGQYGLRDSVWKYQP